ncbi:hypothetical protein NI468_15415 [Acinetobacter lwoffii]|uniref:hypothetical protein n=1 Tax=Acinetobacter lwoffii TaxID=28090 RepID=UPI00209714A1|nr:hypothetical protein [Acinetobacter lwoffii]MCO8071884.1 hypothetical protein [Acinetobacter lwoffii]
MNQANKSSLRVQKKRRLDAAKVKFFDEHSGEILLALQSASHSMENEIRQLKREARERENVIKKQAQINALMDAALYVNARLREIKEMFEGEKK